MHSFEPLPLCPPLSSRSTPDLIGCMFFDLTIMYAFGNTLFIGANVLQLGGILTFTGCTFFENTFLGVENGIGLVSTRRQESGVGQRRWDATYLEPFRHASLCSDVSLPVALPSQFVAQFAGLSTYTFNTFLENNGVVNENCMGQGFLVAGTHAWAGITHYAGG
jgi:hypothetical protein